MHGRQNMQTHLMISQLLARYEKILKKISEIQFLIFGTDTIFHLWYAKYACKLTWWYVYHFLSKCARYDDFCPILMFFPRRWPLINLLTPKKVILQDFLLVTTYSDGVVARQQENTDRCHMLKNKIFFFENI